MIGDVATLTWAPVQALNLSHYVIRYSPELTGVSWRSSGAQLDHVDATSVQIPTRPGTYLIKAVTRQYVPLNNTFLFIDLIYLVSLAPATVAARHALPALATASACRPQPSPTS